MGKKDLRIDVYIAQSADFTKPVLKHLRKLVHQACPEAEETIKWSFASFDYKGPFCSMASFKQHCVFGFWKPKLLMDPGNYLGERFNQGGEAMGNMGRITSLKDLPPDRVILNFIKQAKKVNDEGVKLPSKPQKSKTRLVAPSYLAIALRKNKNARAAHDSFSYSHKKEYLEWLVEAKTEETRKRRLKTSLELITESKVRN
jgi:uncharacterized protein YdeI (YjbR/CyaY-like superfamily)